MEAKKIVGEKAAQYVKDGMLVGLGTGSTAYYATLALGERVKQGLRIKGMPTSKDTENLAKSLGIPIIDFSTTESLDLTIDGADEVGPGLSLIKGGGGALYREKMVALISKQFIVVAHGPKHVASLGKFPLPVEVVPFGWQMTAKRIQKMGGNPQLRQQGDSPYLTDNGNYILDCYFGKIADPASLQTQLKLISGIVDTGLFVGLATLALIGYEDGSVREFRP